MLTGLDVLLPKHFNSKLPRHEFGQYIMHTKHKTLHINTQMYSVLHPFRSAKGLSLTMHGKSIGSMQASLSQRCVPIQLSLP